MWPDSADEVADLCQRSTVTRDIKLQINMSGDTYSSYICYPVVVEMWKHIKGGRHRRAYEAEFTQAERRKISRYHSLWYDWHLIKGTPRRVLITVGVLQLQLRAVQFFGTL